MSRTKLITEELLRALETGSDIGEVMRRHKDSKSTLYAALAMVLPVAQQRLHAAQRQEQAANDNARALLDEEASLTGRIHELESKTAHKEQRLAEVDRSLVQREALLGRVDALERGGFSVEDLERLRGSLATLADAADRTPKEAVEVFFATFDRCS